MKPEMHSLSITVFTPTYNRGEYLKRVFDSLCIQDFGSFEWVIVDDGSTDNTEVVVRGLAAIAKFPIVYLKQPNAGKHIAVNKGLDIARGELFLVHDSDDRCFPNSLAVFHQEWQQIRHRKDDVAGITVLTAYENGKIVGSSFPGDRDIDYRPQYFERHKIVGDKWDIHQTDVFKKHKFPETENEKFCAESLVWNRIAVRYKTLFLNMPLKTVEYLPDGLSSRITEMRIGSPTNVMMYYAEVIGSNRSVIVRLRAAVNFFRFAFHGRKFTFALSAYPFWGVLVSVVAAAFWAADRRRLG